MKSKRVRTANTIKKKKINEVGGFIWFGDLLYGYDNQDSVVLA